MSQDDDIALIRSGYELWGRGEFEQALALMHPEVEWIPPAYAPEPGPHRGHDAVRRGIDAYFQGFAEFRPEIAEIRPTDRPGTYLAEVQTYTKGRTSGIESTIDVLHLIEVRDGKIARLQVFTDRDEALEASGLSGS